MKNFPIEFDGQTYWRSRSCCVSGFIFCRDDKGNWFVLANQRGTGAPSNVGKWNCPCGYIDYDEDGTHAVSREIFEETGVKVPLKNMMFDSVHFAETGEQNITLRYVAVLFDKRITDFKFSTEHNEPNETSDIRWIAIDDVNKFSWAFSHNYLIKFFFKKHIGV